ncbi:MAG: tetratricopeptide repeat protein [Bacteroidota bacterium]
MRNWWWCLLLPTLAIGQTVDEVKALYRDGRIADARRAAEQLLKKNGEDADAHYWMAAVLMHREIRDLEGASDHIEEAVDRNPNNADYQYLLGGIYGQTASSAGIFKQAFLAPKIKKAFLRAVELDPNHVEARISLAQYYLMAPGIMGGDDEEGFRQLDEATKRNERRGRLAKAAMLERKNRLPEAEEQLKALTASLPTDWIPHKNLGYFYLRRNRFDESLRSMQRYVALRPDTSDAFDSFGEVQLAAGRTDDAIITLKKGLAIEPNLGSSLFLLGQAYEKKGMKAEAKEAYQKAILNDRSEQRKKLAVERLKALE